MDTKASAGGPCSMKTGAAGYWDYKASGGKTGGGNQIRYRMPSGAAGAVAALFGSKYNDLCGGACLELMSIDHGLLDGNPRSNAAGNLQFLPQQGKGGNSSLGATGGRAINWALWCWGEDGNFGRAQKRKRK